MCDIDKGASRLHMESLQLVSHLKTELRIQVGQRLIHEENCRFRCQGSRDGNTLLLTAGELCRITVHEHADLDDPGNSADGFIDLFLREFSVFCQNFSSGYDGIFLI